ncbi:MAG: aminopeptidase [Nanoarchaeota archaeon]|nr:aminopeptidase [Nanoarchaeota archaeon]
MAKKKPELLRKKESAWLSNPAGAVQSFAEDYKGFLAVAKTERSATREIIRRLEKLGFMDIEMMMTLKEGDKVFFNIKDKSVIAMKVGKETDGLMIIGSHLDSPRLDIKPNPLYEANNLALMKTHYYGGVKKYQWTNVDLAMYGVAYTKEGVKHEFSIGEKDDEPRFLVSDLLPHLAKKQMEKTGNEIVEAEQLNVFVGNIPVKDKDAKDKVKMAVLELLNRKYGMIEEDFSFAELNFVPAGTPRDIGFDKALISGYGHDDKSATFANLRALLDSKSKNTAVAYFSDKEEIGSVGNSGAASFVLLDFAEIVVKKLGLSISPKELLVNSKAVSADVSSALDPNFPEVSDEKNATQLGFGVTIEKYTGSGGKYSANDAHAEYMNEIRKILQKNKVTWQTSELGKVDIGGGGTIALYMSRFGMDTVDAGPGVFGMHSPREILSKVDLYEAYKFYKGFFEQ